MIKEIAFMLILAGAFLFGRAYHDIDLSANLINQAIMNEQGTYGILSNTDIYLNGMREMLMSQLLMVMGAMTLMFQKVDKNGLA